MKIALFSDIHANLPALEAFFADLAQQQPDVVYCLGDLVGYNTWPNEVIDEIRRRRIPVIAGNHDEEVQQLLSASAMGEPKNFAYQLIREDNRQYLSTLPAHIRFEYRFNGTLFTVLLVHGSPRSNQEYLLEDKPEAELREIFAQAGAVMICFGHSHIPYHRVLNDNAAIGKHFLHAVNIGSVGKPKDGDPMGCYVLLTMGENTGVSPREICKVEFRRFAYDIEKAARAIEQSPLPKELADMLRRGY